MSIRLRPKSALLAATVLCSVVLGSCASDLEPVKKGVPPVDRASSKFAALNRNRDMPVVYVKLDEDVLRPVKKTKSEKLPTTQVGPFELRDETLAAALQLVLDDSDIPMAFQTNKAMSNTITVTSLSGPLDQVVDKLCGLADLYCSYENGTLVVKDTESFTVSLPPMIADNYDPFVNGLKAITGGQAYVDSLTRSLIYTTTHRNNERAKEYFDRLRANTAMIVYEIQVWEVLLSDQTQTGVDWEQFAYDLGGVHFNLTRDGTPSISGAVGIGAQYTSDNISADAVLSFLQTQGAVKTISQPQLTVLSGSDAKLRVGNERDYVSQITRTVGVNTADNVSVTTSKLLTGLTFEIQSAWDDGTVYGGLKISLQNLIRMGTLDVGGTTIQLPETSDRTLETKLRVRPGDAVIIGGIVEERDENDQEGPPGFKKPLFTTSKTKNASNSELVFMLRPRVVVYTDKLPTGAVLQTGGMRAEPQRIQNTAKVLPRQGQELPVKTNPSQAMSNYLDALSADQIAPTP